MNILEDFYYGKITPSERYTKSGSEYQKLSHKLSDDIDNLLSSINDKEKQLCEKIIDDIYKINSISEEECFISGFCIGAKLVWEITQYKSNNFY